MVKKLHNSTYSHFTKPFSRSVYLYKEVYSKLTYEVMRSIRCYKVLWIGYRNHAGTLLLEYVLSYYTICDVFC